jgi:cytochrome P450
LAEHPEVQEKLFDEINQNVNPLEPMTPAGLDKLSYTKAVIKETFRLAEKITKYIILKL